MKQDISELALPATIYRVTETEKTIRELKNELSDVRISLSKAIEQIQANALMKADIKNVKPLENQIMVPEELKHCRGKKYIRDGKVVYGKKNRNAEQTAKRWSLWKAQCELGIPVSAIARAWGCDHASILHAKRKGFVAYGKK